MFGFPHHKKDDDSSNEEAIAFDASAMQAVSEEEDDPVVYGFFDEEDTRFSRGSRRFSLVKAAYTGAAIIAALAVILLISRFAMSSIIKSQDKTAEQQAQSQAGNAQADAPQNAQTQPPAWEIAKVPGKNDVKELVTKHLFWDGNDISCKQGEIVVDILGGFVQITQNVNSANIEPLGAKTCVTRAATRAAATSKALYAHAIKDVDGSMTPFGEVLWIVRDETGDSYLSVNYAVDGTPDSGDGIEVLKQAAHYRLSDTLYADLKLTDIPQQTAEPPTDIDGSVIYSTADW